MIRSIPAKQINKYYRASYDSNDKFTDINKELNEITTKLIGIQEMSKDISKNKDNLKKIELKMNENKITQQNHVQINPNIYHFDSSNPASDNDFKFKSFSESVEIFYKEIKGKFKQSDILEIDIIGFYNYNTNHKLCNKYKINLIEYITDNTSIRNVKINDKIVYVFDKDMDKIELSFSISKISKSNTIINIKGDNFFVLIKHYHLSS